MKQLSPRVAQLAIAAGALTVFLAHARRDLALHKPVRISSVLLGDPARVVNGLIEWGTYAVHTRTNKPAWLEIDLGQPSPISEVRVFGRGDGFHTDTRSALTIEISTDGHRYARVGACPAVVTQASPCLADLGGAPARYVRLAHPTHLVLSEVEVFGPR